MKDEKNNINIHVHMTNDVSFIHISYFFNLLEIITIENAPFAFCIQDSSDYPLVESIPPM